MKTFIEPRYSIPLAIWYAQTSRCLVDMGPRDSLRSATSLLLFPPSRVTYSLLVSPRLSTITARCFTIQEHLDLFTV